MQVDLSNKNTIAWLVALAYLLRLGSLQDGLACARAPGVDWWLWHLIGWLVRDVVQVLVLWQAGRRLGLGDVVTWAAWWFAHVLVNAALHAALYSIGERIRT